MPDQIVRTRLHLPRPLDPAPVGALLTRLMGSDVPRPLALETHSGASGVVFVLAVATTATQRLKRVLRSQFPGIQYEAAPAADVASVARIVARPGGLPLATTDPELLVAGIFNALAARRGDEHVAIQVVLGSALRPQQLQPSIADPMQPLTGRLLNGVRPASSAVRNHLQAHAGEARLNVTLRVGVSADTSKRRTALVWEMFGALQPLEAPGVHLSVVRDTPGRWERAASKPSGHAVSAEALIPLLAWPLGERDYPGVQGFHPRLLAVPEIVSRTKSVFAVGTAPGPERMIGFDTPSRLFHSVAIGPTGAGKSTLFEHLILDDIAASRPCVVIEPKAQLVNSILDRAPASAMDRIVVLDATDEDAPVGFNPLDVGDRDPDIVVDGILAALAAVFEDGWGPRTEYLIQGALLSLARAGISRGEPYTLIDLPLLLTDATFRRPVIAAVQDDTILATFWAEYESMRPGQRAAAIAAPLNKLRKIVLRKPLVRVLGQSRPRFRLRDVFREKKTILVPLNEALIGAGAAKLLGSLVVAEVYLATMERASEKDPTKHPGMVFVDEVQEYLHLPTPIESVLAISRSYGVGWHLAHQYRWQLTPALRAGIDANARTKFSFTLTPADAKEMAKQAPQLTAEDFQELGEYEIYTHLMAGGKPAGWCSAKTLPPLPQTGIAEQIRAASRRLYGAIDFEPIATAPATPNPSPTVTTPAVSSTHQKARRA